MKDVAFRLCMIYKHRDRFIIKFKNNSFHLDEMMRISVSKGVKPNENIISKDVKLGKWNFRTTQIRYEIVHFGSKLNC